MRNTKRELNDIRFEFQPSKVGLAGRHDNLSASESNGCCVAGLSRRYRQRAADCGPHRGGRPRVHGGQPGPADHPAPAQQAALLQNIIGDRNTRVAGRKSSSWYRFIYYSFFNKL